MRDGSELPGFGPSFARRAHPGERVGVVDIGSNSVRMVIFEGATRAPAYFFNEKVLCGLGAGLQETGRLDPNGKMRALLAIKRFVMLAEAMHVGTLDAVATAALRDAEDGREFKDQIQREIGVPIRIASGEDEARLAAQGVLLGSPTAEGVVADLGGASLEFCEVADGRTGRGATTPLGPLRLAKSGLEGKALDAHIDRIIEASPPIADGKGRKLYVVGGSWRAMARAHMKRTNYPLNVLHGYTLSLEEAMEAADWAASRTPQELGEKLEASTSRLAVTPLGARVMSRLLRVMKPNLMFVSAFGLREGVLYENLPTPLLALDPLLHACEVIEQRRSRFPGFGEELHEWVKPIIADESERDRRCIHAVCVLADVVWRTHPDYRPLACFELVTRGNIAGVSHVDRVFVGTMLMYRYKGGAAAARDLAAVELLPKERQELAKAIGKVIRLGAMLAGPTVGALRDVGIAREGGKLVLSLPADRANLSGEVVEKRLASAASALGLESEIRIDQSRGEAFWLDDLRPETG